MWAYSPDLWCIHILLHVQINSRGKILPSERDEKKLQKMWTSLDVQDWLLQINQFVSLVPTAFQEKLPWWSLGIHWCWIFFGIAWAPRITSLLCPNLYNCLTSQLPPSSIQSHHDVIILKFLKKKFLLKWPSTLNKSNRLEKVRLGGSSMHAADHLTWWDKTRRDPLRGGETKPYRRLQNSGQLYKTLRSPAFSRVRQGAGSWSLWPARRDFWCFLGLFPDRSQAGGRPRVPPVTPIQVLYKQRLGNSHNCNLHVHHPRQLRRHCLMFFSTGKSW